MSRRGLTVRTFSLGSSQFDAPSKRSSRPFVLGPSVCEWIPITWVPLNHYISTGPHDDRKTDLCVCSSAAARLVLQLDVRHRLTLGHRVKLGPLQPTSGHSCQATNMLHGVKPGPAGAVMWPTRCNVLTVVITVIWLFQPGFCGSMF